MTRGQAINIARKFDGEYPIEAHESYLKYYEMSKRRSLTKYWINGPTKNYLKKVDGRWKPKFKIE